MLFLKFLDSSFELGNFIFVAVWVSGSKFLLVLILSVYRKVKFFF